MFPLINKGISLQRFRALRLKVTSSLCQMQAAPVGIDGRNASNSVGACWGPSRIFIEMRGYMVYKIELIGIKSILISSYKPMVNAEDEHSPAESQLCLVESRAA